MKNKWTVCIEKVDNGYRVKFTGGDIPGDAVYVSEDKKQLVDMFYDIINYFGEAGSRYDLERLTVSLTKGDKYTTPKKGKI